MGRYKLEKRMPLSLDRTIVGLCGDYDRRERVLARSAATPEVLAQYERLNRGIDRAVADVCEDGIREQIRLDIGAGRGARRTPLYFISEGTYKSRKRETKWRIAEELKLL